MGLRRVLSVVLSGVAIICNAENVITLGSRDFSADTLLRVTVGPGIRTTGVRLTATGAGSGSTATNIFYTTIDMNNPSLRLTGVQALDTECASENVLKMGERKNSHGGLRYIAGVNGDHANLNGDHKRTNGITYINNRLYNFGVGDDGWKQFGSYVTVGSAKDVLITGSVTLRQMLRFPDGKTYGIGLNTQRREDCLVIYTPEHGATSKTNCWGRECQMKLVSGSIAEGNAVFEVTSETVGDCSGNESHGNMAIPADGYVLSGVGFAYYLMEQLRPGYRLSMLPPEFYIDGRKATDVTSIVGGCPIIVENGEPITDEECNSLLKTTAIQITPTARTAIGYNEERTEMVMLVADSYKSNGCTSGLRAGYGATSSGLDFRMLADFMIYLGCHTATAMDGGGSSQLYNIGQGICNIPYGLESYLRPVANGFFAASATPADNTVAAIEVLQKNVRLEAGETFTPTVFGYNRYGVLVDTDITDFSLSVDSRAGMVSGKTFRAGSSAVTTVGVVSYGSIKCGVRLVVNGGGEETFSTGDDVDIEVRPPYPGGSHGAVDATECDPDDQVEPMYYNLQGIPVSVPGKGFYIVRRGSSVSKEYIR